VSHTQLKKKARLSLEKRAVGVGGRGWVGGKEITGECAGAKVELANFFIQGLKRRVLNATGATDFDVTAHLQVCG